jgi:Trk-type K+ transport system membrane component
MNNMQDDKLKDLLAGTNVKAGENLKYRIMQQIETEKALSRKKVRSSRPLVGNTITTLGIIYILIAIVGTSAFFTGGKEVSFFASSILIASAGSIFWMISVFDERRRSKHKN